MSYIPQEFEESLEREFNGRLRIRWSPLQEQYRIEQKVARAVMWPDKPILENDDEATMIRDGYFFVLSIMPRDKMKCKKCGSILDVPYMSTSIVICDICKLMGYAYKKTAGFFPLNEKLITHLKSIDPERGMSKEQIAKMRENNEAIVRSQQRSITNNIEAYGKDNFTKLAGIAQTGFTGKESAWLDAPALQVSNERQKLGVDHGSKIIGI